METMYPGKVNSPATVLDGAINDSVQTINVVDGSVLPAAPNLAVIGTGEDAETILYGVKTNNVLTTVTRGFQGTAKAWNSGTVIARMFTEWDYAKLKQNIEALLPSLIKLSAFASTTSAELAGVISDKTGTGALMFASANGFASGAKGYKSASTQTISNITITKVVLDGEEFDVLGEFDETTNYRFTAQVAGYYFFAGSCNYYPSVDQASYQCRIYKDNVALQCPNVLASGTGGAVVTSIGIVYLAINGYLELHTYQNSGGDAKLQTGENTFLIIKRLY